MPDGLDHQHIRSLLHRISLRASPPVSATRRCALGRCDGTGWIVHGSGREQRWEMCSCLEAEGRRWRLTQGFGSEEAARFARPLDALDGRQGAALAVARAYVAGWPQRRNLVFQGPPGAGKTSLAHAIVFELAGAGVVPLVRRVSSLLRELRAGIEDGTQARRIEGLCTADLVVLDDLGAHGASEWSLERMLEIVDERYLHRRPVVVTSMWPLGELGRGGRAGDMWGAITRRLGEDAEVCVLPPPGGERGLRLVPAARGPAPAGPVPPPPAEIAWTRTTVKE